MKEEEILPKLLSCFKETVEINQLIQKEINGKDIFDSYYESDLYKERIYKIQDLDTSIGILIGRLYKTSINLNYYYFDCPSQVYLNHIEEREKIYFDENIEADEKDFLLNEIQYFNNPEVNRSLDFGNFDCYSYGKYIDYEERFKITIRRKLEYLSQRLEKYNLTVDIQEETNIIDDNGNMIGYGTEAIVRTKIDKEIEPIETKSKNQLTANQIILLLQEIGFFIHPKIEDASKVKQAELISLITGLHQKNIKTNIQKLDKSVSENGANYQRDIDKINKILDDLV
ncbi:hypothetical protein [Polaribacter sp. Hel_I_88]|uniref:hypothetical protein n=1 Tax=Polaribacter sp. Hel_I_88 TaxID=1250006 RepID=UPI0004799EB8|nr:hypothetical protein [Polaribacter sp. Hel_I_88]